jgi:DNA polymerase-3 subunit delta
MLAPVRHGASDRVVGAAWQGVRVPPSRRTASAARSWREAAPAPVVVVTGAEQLLASRAVDRVVHAVRAAAAEGDAGPAVEVTELSAEGYQPGSLAVLASPSLFEEPRVVLVRGLAEADDALQLDVLAYLADVQHDVVLVLHHGGGPRAKKVLDTAKAAAGAVWVDCPAVKNDNDRLAFVAAEFADRRRTVSTRAAQMLVEAYGSDLAELASACAGLLDDVQGGVDVDHVRSVTQGRAEADGFEVADAVVARDAGKALLLVRRALDTGVDPIPLVAVIAMKVRAMAKVAAAGRGPGAARDLGMASWMVDRARRDLAAWSAPDLADAVVALAEADTALKGGVMVGRVSRGRTEDRDYTIERLVLRLTGGSRTDR